MTFGASRFAGPALGAGRFVWARWREVAGWDGTFGCDFWMMLLDSSNGLKDGSGRLLVAGPVRSFVLSCVLWGYLGEAI